MFRGDSSLLPSDFTLDPPVCFTRLACYVYHISRHNIHIKWILLRVILHASWNMRFSIHQHSWVKPLLYRRLSLSLRLWKIATLHFHYSKFYNGGHSAVTWCIHWYIDQWMNLDQWRHWSIYNWIAHRWAIRLQKWSHRNVTGMEWRIGSTKMATVVATDLYLTYTNV